RSDESESATRGPANSRITTTSTAPTERPRTPGKKRGLRRRAPGSTLIDLTEVSGRDVLGNLQHHRPTATVLRLVQLPGADRRSRQAYAKLSPPEPRSFR